nr:hypothetical protein [Tanacetum cinerariifolium]
MRRVGKGFSGVETPLFENMLEVREVDAEEKVQVPAQDDVVQENVTEEIADDVFCMQEDDVDVQEAVEIVTTAKLMTEVVTTVATQVVAASTPIPAAKPAVVAVSTPISAAKPKVLKIVAAAPAVSTRKRKRVELHDATLAGTLSVKDKGKGILVEDPKPMKKKDQIEMDANREKRWRKLEVVVDEDDDVFIEATPIDRKVPVVNYKIVMINNKPREDLEDLWKIVKARFSTSKPINFSDNYLLATLKTMFEKTYAQDVIWRSQQTEYGQALLLELMLLKRSKENTKCVSAAGEELTAAKNKLILLV